MIRNFNLARIHERFSAWGIYLSQLGFKRPWENLLTRMPSAAGAAGSAAGAAASKPGDLLHNGQ